MASLIVTGTGLQEYGNSNTEENVAAKHENQADSVRYRDSFDPHHCSLSLQGIQLWKVTCLYCDAIVVRKALSYISIYYSVRIETMYVLYVFSLLTFSCLLEQKGSVFSLLHYDLV